MEASKTILSIRSLAVCVAGLLAAANASAGGYAGFGVGESKLNGAEDVVIGTTYDDSDTGFRLFGGYQFNKNFAVEGSFNHLGTFTGSGRILSVGITDEWEASTVSASGVGTVWIGEKFALFAKLGLSIWAVADSYTIGSSTTDAEASGLDFSYGLGAEVDFTPGFGLRLEYEGFTGLGDEETNLEEGADASMISLNAVIRWGE